MGTGGACLGCGEAKQGAGTRRILAVQSGTMERGHFVLYINSRIGLSFVIKVLCPCNYLLVFHVTRHTLINYINNVTYKGQLGFLF